MSLIDDYFKDVPEYYDSMCMDGYTPEQIRYALHKKEQTAGRTGRTCGFRGFCQDQERGEDQTMSEKKEDKKKKKQSVLEKEIFSIMEKSMKTALDAAVDDLLKDWNKEIKIKL